MPARPAGWNKERLGRSARLCRPRARVDGPTAAVLWPERCGRARGATLLCGATLRGHLATGWRADLTALVRRAALELFVEHLFERCACSLRAGCVCRIHLCDKPPHADRLRHMCAAPAFWTAALSIARLCAPSSLPCVQRNPTTVRTASRVRLRLCFLTRDNMAAFHNWWHVCDVTHAVSVLLCEGGARRLLPAEECFALMLAALCHDAEHPGTTNGYLARVQDPMVRNSRPGGCSYCLRLSWSRRGAAHE